MARLRYNGLTTTLGASLTNSATSVTLGAALTYGGGTNVPTIVAGDYIPLTILDSNGAVSEIVHLTAYTAAATTGTIVRGVEGTAGVAHNSGDKVVHAVNSHDAIRTLKPAALHATYGDDFTGTSLDGKWTRVTYVSGDEQYAQGAGSTWLQIDTARGQGTYYYQAWSGGSSDFTIVARISTYLTSGTPSMFGLVALSSSHVGAAACFYNGNATQPFVATVTNSTGPLYSTSAVAKGAVAIGASDDTAFGGAYYLALNRTGTTWKMRYSINGEIWSPWSLTVSESSTIARIGFGAIFGTPQAFAIDFFDVQ